MPMLDLVSKISVVFFPPPPSLVPHCTREGGERQEEEGENKLQCTNTYTFIHTYMCILTCICVYTVYLKIGLQIWGVYIIRNESWNLESTEPAALAPSFAPVYMSPFWSNAEYIEAHWQKQIQQL